MTTWVPTCAPNLWGHPSWECPSCSRVMHAAHPWNVTLTGRISSSDSLLVLHLNASSTPHARTSRDLGFSLTDNWCVVWDPPLVAQLCCLSHYVRCLIALTMLLRTHQHILVIDLWPLFATLAHMLCETLAHTARGTNLQGPIITSGQRPRTGRFHFS